VTKPFQLVAGHPVLDLVNTLDWRFRESGPEELLNTYDDLLRFAAQSSLITPRQTQRLRTTAPQATKKILESTKDLREAASQLLYALMDDHAPPPDAIKKLNQHLQSATQNRTLHWTNSRFQLTWPEGETSPQLPLWLLAQSAAELLTADVAEKIRACANPECRWLFLDTSKNHSRRWCDMAVCGNRLKARRFKARQRP
jgi:predicted RNA-binding Zn ribbon-like protein